MRCFVMIQRHNKIAGKDWREGSRYDDLISGDTPIDLNLLR